MAKFVSYLAGKKTYLVAFGTVVAAGILLGLGKIDAGQATLLVSVAGGMAGIGAKLERHSQQTLALIKDLAQATVDAKAKPGALYGDGIKLAQDGVALGQAIEADDTAAIAAAPATTGAAATGALAK